MAQDGIEVYSPRARFYHWLTAFLVLIQFPIGFYMYYRGNEMPYVDAEGTTKVGLWDATTGFLYDSHKVIGVVVLAVVLARLIYRFRTGAPRSDASVPAALTGISHLVHWSIYVLLVAVPIGGYLGSSFGGYLKPFGFALPAVTMEDKDASKEILGWHGVAAKVLLLLILIHVAAAIYHRVVRKDRVVERMLPKKVA